jgi:hypothetical protein
MINTYADDCRSKTGGVLLLPVTGCMSKITKQSGTVKSFLLRAASEKTMALFILAK